MKFTQSTFGSTKVAQEIYERESSLLEETMNQFMLTQSNLKARNSEIKAFHKNLEAYNKDFKHSTRILKNH